MPNTEAANGTTIREFKSTPMSKILQAVGNLREALRGLPSADLNPIAIVMLNNSTFRELSQHLVRYCSSAEITPVQTDTEMLWSDIKFVNDSAPTFDMDWAFLTDEEITNGWARNPVGKQYYRGFRITSVERNDSQHGWRVHYQRPRQAVSYIPTNLTEEHDVYVGGRQYGRNVWDNAPNDMPIAIPDNPAVRRYTRDNQSLNQRLAGVFPDAPNTVGVAVSAGRSRYRPPAPPVYTNQVQGRDIGFVTFDEAPTNYPEDGQNTTVTEVAPTNDDWYRLNLPLRDASETTLPGAAL